MFFEQEVARIRQVQHPNLVVAIEHFGSTAVPGLAKGIIDLVGVGVHSLALTGQQACCGIGDAGILLLGRRDPRSDLPFYQRVAPNGPRTHHLHVWLSHTVNFPPAIPRLPASAPE